MNKIQRVTAVLEGRTPDRPPVSFWYHFPADQVSGPPAVEAHLRHVETYDLDFLKIMDDNRYPRPVTPTGTIAETRDLDRLTVLAGDEQSFGRQLELIGALAQRLRGQLLMATTLFNPWTTLRNMTVPASDVHGPPVPTSEVDPRDTAMSRFLRQSPDALARALAVIAESLAHFARHCLEAGADGIYLSVRDDWVDTPANGPGTYDSLALPGDLEILTAARRGKFNILHVCGKALDFRRFAKYPVQVLNWADRTSGPPSPKWPARCLRPSPPAWITSARWSAARPTTAPAKCPTPWRKPPAARCSSPPVARSTPRRFPWRTSAPSAEPWNVCRERPPWRSAAVPPLQKGTEGVSPE